MKIKRKLITGFSVVLIVTAVMGAAGVYGMQQLLDAEAFIAGSYMRAIEYAGEAESHLYRMQLENRYAIINSLYDDSKTAADSYDAFELHAGEFVLCLEKCRDVFSPDETVFDETASDEAVSGQASIGELLAFYDRIEELFMGEYLPKARESIEAAMTDIPNHSNKLYIYTRLASADEDAAQIQNLLQGSVDYNRALAGRAGAANTQLMQTYALLLVAILAFAVVIAVIVSILTIRGVIKSVKLQVRPPKETGAPSGAIPSSAAQKKADGGSFGIHLSSGTKKDTPDDIEDGSDGRFIAPDARVLVVDDAHADLKAVEVLLRPYNIRADLVSSGVSALQAVQFGRYDIVFMDHKMPGMDGVEATSRIRMLGKTELPIIVLTDNAYSDIMETFTEHGFNDFLSKPISPVVLDALLRKWIPKAKRRSIGV